MENRTVLQEMLGRYTPDATACHGVLVLEWDLSVSEMIRGWLPAGSDACAVMTVNDAILLIPENKPDVIVLSGVRGMGIADAVTIVHDVDPRVVLVVVAEFKEVDAVRRAAKDGAVFRILQRPLAREDVANAVAEALQHCSTLAAVGHLVERCHFLESSQASLQQALTDYHERLERTVLLAHRSTVSRNLIERLQSEVPSLADFAKWSMSQPVPQDQMAFRRAGLECLASFCEILGGHKADAGTGRWELKRKRVRVDKLVDEVVESFAQSNEFPGCTIRSFSNPQIGSAMVDPDWLKQALEQILRNAAAAAPQGSVDLMVESFDEDQVRVSIRDTGCGMGPATLARCSEPFFSTRQGHSGLGLAVARKVAEAHGGRLTVTSRVSSGTTVEVILARE